AIKSKGYVVLRYHVKRHEHEPIADTDVMELKQVLVAESATLIDSDVVVEAIEEQEERIRLAREEAKGIQRLPVEANGQAEEDDGDDG
ncbi:MAG: hypothetical protein LC798_07520, partial [Chloroflexi bacterium]|nr:hypothetical protein [Chloroflexota bacterium]